MGRSTREIKHVRCRQGVLLEVRRHKLGRMRLLRLDDDEVERCELVGRLDELRGNPLGTRPRNSLVPGVEAQSEKVE